MKINQLIVPGLTKNLVSNERLTSFQIVNFKFSTLCWESLGLAIAKSKFLSKLVIIGCNLNTQSNLQIFMKGVNENNSLEKLDLSDN